MNQLLKILLFVAFAAVTIWTYLAPNAVGFQNPSLARIIFFHLPPAFIGTGFLFAGAFFSAKYLKHRRLEWDVRAASAIEMGFLMCIVTMISGILFSKVQWGAWWHWDPRQTSFLMVLLLFAAYFALRAAFSDEAKRATNAAGYSLASVLPAIFLIFVFPRLPHVLDTSLHPSTAIRDTVGGASQGESPVTVVDEDGSERPAPGQSAGFDRTYSSTLIGVGALLLLTSVWAYRIRVRAGVLELLVEDMDEGLGSRGDSPASGVVRPVSVSDEGGRTTPQG